MNLTDIQALFAPALAPMGPALAFGNQQYQALLADGVSDGAALGGAIVGTLGVELTGGLACAMGLRAYENRDFKVLALSVASAIAYGVFVFRGITTGAGESSRVFGAAVLISLIAYVMLGVHQMYKRQDGANVYQDQRQDVVQQRQAQADAAQVAAELQLAQLQIAQTTAEVERLKAEARLVRAGGVAAGQVSSGGVHGGHRFAVDPALIALIEDYWKQHPAASLRDAATACGCSPTTAGKYKP